MLKLIPMLYSLVLSLLLAGCTPSVPVVGDYDQALSIAQQSGRPVFLLFTSLSCPHNEAIQEKIRNDSTIQRYLERHYVNAWLYVDDTRPLPEPQTVQWKGETRTLRTYGNKWAHLEWVKFQKNLQPLAAIVDEEGKVVCQAVTYQELQADFLGYLQRGVERSK